MHTSLRLLLVVWVAAWMGAPLLPAASASAKKKQAATRHTPAATKPAASADTDATPAKNDATKDKAKAKADADDSETAPVMTPAAVSTISVEDIRDFDTYPKQIQSLVQSSMALTRLELGYLYGSHEPGKGGMDCSGTIYHVLHFQGLKDVPRQSDEMCQWVDKKSQLHLTPTATSFESEEFAALKPGDLLFWTHTTQTTRKLPVTHVMIYLGKLRKSGRRIVFGSSDGRSFHGERRSGVSVFDFTLPREGGASRFYGYGPAPGLLPPEPRPAGPERPMIAAVKAAASAKEAPAPKQSAIVKASSAGEAAPAPKSAVASKETPASRTSVALQESATLKETPAPREEVRRAIALSAGESAAMAGNASTAGPGAKPEVKKTVAVADTPARAGSSTAGKPKAATTTKKRSATVTRTTRRRAPAAPPQSAIEQRIDRVVSSVRRFFQQ